MSIDIFDREFKDSIYNFAHEDASKQEKFLIENTKINHFLTLFMNTLINYINHNDITVQQYNNIQNLKSFFSSVNMNYNSIHYFIVVEKKAIPISTYDKLLNMKKTLKTAIENNGSIPERR